MKLDDRGISFLGIRTTNLSCCKKSFDSLLFLHLFSKPTFQTLDLKYSRTWLIGNYWNYRDNTNAKAPESYFPLQHLICTSSMCILYNKSIADDDIYCSNTRKIDFRIDLMLANSGVFKRDSQNLCCEQGCRRFKRQSSVFVCHRVCLEATKENFCGSNAEIKEYVKRLREELSIGSK